MATINRGDTPFLVRSFWNTFKSGFTNTRTATLIQSIETTSVPMANFNEFCRVPHSRRLAD